MSWKGIRYTTAPLLLDHEQTLRYLVLRRARLIGMLWSEAGHYKLSPLGTDFMGLAENISITRLMALIEALECQRKPVQSAGDSKELPACAA